jgi:hypothetical protein
MGGLDIYRQFRLLPVLALALLATGCTRQDTDKLGHIGQKLSGLIGVVKESLNSGCEGLYAGMGLEARVAARLRWDKNLADAAIEVKANGGDIELKGTVSDGGQAQRAQELAETTAGVEKVTNLLKISRSE